MRIGILGCGYVGEAAARHWKQKGHFLSATTRRSEKIPYLESFIDRVCHLENGSLAPFMSELDVLLISVAPDAGANYASTYLQTAQRVAEESAKISSLQQILYTGSLSVYGDHAGRWIDETTPVNPAHENAKILFETENCLLKCASSKMKVCVFRLGEIYGPGREIENRLKRMQHQPFAGTGDSYTNLIHLDDIVRALDFALSHKLQGIYNLCNDEHIRRKEFYEQICRKNQLPSIRWDPNRTSAHQGNRRASNQKLKNEGFIFSHLRY